MRAAGCDFINWTGDLSIFCLSFELLGCASSLLHSEGAGWIQHGWHGEAVGSCEMASVHTCSCRRCARAAGVFSRWRGAFGAWQRTRGHLQHLGRFFPLSHTASLFEGLKCRFKKKKRRLKNIWLRKQDTDTRNETITGVLHYRLPPKSQKYLWVALKFIHLCSQPS